MGKPQQHQLDPGKGPGKGDLPDMKAAYQRLRELNDQASGWHEIRTLLELNDPPQDTIDKIRAVYRKYESDHPKS